MTKHELMNEADMLQGNINRMMVTDDTKELLSMYMWAERRLKTIYKERVKELDNVQHRKTVKAEKGKIIIE